MTLERLGWATMFALVGALVACSSDKQGSGAGSGGAGAAGDPFELPVHPHTPARNWLQARIVYDESPKPKDIDATSEKPQTPAQRARGR